MLVWIYVNRFFGRKVFLFPSPKLCCIRTVTGSGVLLGRSKWLCRVPSVPLQNWTVPDRQI